MSRSSSVAVSFSDSVPPATLPCLVRRLVRRIAGADRLAPVSVLRLYDVVGRLAASSVLHGPPSWLHFMVLLEPVEPPHGLRVAGAAPDVRFCR